MAKILKRGKLLRVGLIVGLVFLIVGLIGVLPTLYFQTTQTGTASAAPAQLSSKVAPLPSIPVASLVEGMPVSIAIPSLNIDLTVIPGYYNQTTGVWTLTDTDAQYATPSVLPNNETGNTLIYGHYRKEVFEYLHLIHPGSEAIVTTSNGYQFDYKYTGTFAVQPNDTSIFDSVGLPRLTVQTCSGDWFQNRQMYQFTYLSYTKL
jgi:LPXTG-site transpeptidase (sortase) family protein